MSLLDQVGEIPTLPQVTLELIRNAFVKEPDIQYLSTIIERDPTLTAKLFKTVNSAAFGLRAKVTSAQQATSLLGLDTLRATIISIALGDYFVKNTFGEAIEGKNFCLHSLATGAVMREIASIMELENTEQLYLLGLLHDLGKLVLDMAPNGDYAEVFHLVEQGESYEEAERKIFNSDNRTVWKELAERWAFPEGLVELWDGAIFWKTRVPTSRFLEDASRIADTLGYRLRPPASTRAPAPRLDTLVLLGLEEMDRFGQAVSRQMKIIREILDMPGPEPEVVFQSLLRVSRHLSLSNARYAKLHRDLNRKVEILEKLNQIFTRIIKSLQGESLAFSLIESLISCFKVNSAFLLQAKNSGDLSGYAGVSPEEGPEEAGINVIHVPRDRIPPSIARCMEEGIPVRVTATGVEKTLAGCLGEVALAWVAPVIVRTRPAAVLGLGVSRHGFTPLEDEEFGRILQIIAGEVSLIMENIHLYTRVKREARTDPLTRTANRRTILQILNGEFARFLREGTPLSVALFDMDHFKVINDTCGHLAGDEFLSRAAEILRKGIRECDYIGRLGGDEFLVVFPGTGPEEAASVAERTRLKLLNLCNNFQTEQLPAPLSVSVGIAGADKEMTRADELILRSDRAMYEAKEAGRNRTVVHAPAAPP